VDGILPVRSPALSAWEVSDGSVVFGTAMRALRAESSLASFQPADRRVIQSAMSIAGT